MLSIDLDYKITQPGSSRIDFDAHKELLILGCCYDYDEHCLKCDKYTFDVVSKFATLYNNQCELKASLWKDALRKNDVKRVTKFHPLYEKVKETYDKLLEENHLR